MLCPECGATAGKNSRFCPECGAGLDPSARPPAELADEFLDTRRPTVEPVVYPRNPPLSPHVCWLTFLLPGAAHWVHGQMKKGFIILVVGMIAFFVLPFVGWFLVEAIAAVDAYKVGKALARGRPVGKMEFFPGVEGR